MRGISINGIHTAKDLHFVMTMQKIETPTVKTYKTDVPGRNGSLDLSEFLTGDIQYNNRQLNFKFLANGNRTDVIKIISSFMNYHGRNAEIITDDFSDYYYSGRMTAKYVDFGVYVEFELSVDAEPFRMAKEKQQAVFQINSAAIFSINNPGVPVIPTVTVSDSVTIIRNEKRFSLSKGKYYENELKLFNGRNDFSIEGNAEVIFEYREAFI